MSQLLRPTLCLAAILLLTGCHGEEREFQKIGHVTRIRVVDNMDKDIRPEITDARRIEQLVNFFDARRSGWTKPWYGVPVASVRAEFYDGSVRKGYLGVGRSFFEGGGMSWWSKSANSSDIQQFLDLVEVPQEKIKK